MEEQLSSFSVIGVRKNPLDLLVLRDLKAVSFGGFDVFTKWVASIRFDRERIERLAKDLGVSVVEPTTKEASNKTARDYWIMRGEELHGPFKAVNLVEAAKYKQLKKRDLLGNSPSGPWEKLTKEHLQSMHQGNDVEIK